MSSGINPALSKMEYGNKKYPARSQGQKSTLSFCSLSKYRELLQNRELRNQALRLTDENSAKRFFLPSCKVVGIIVYAFYFH
jgi:hypothetical protein